MKEQRREFLKRLIFASEPAIKQPPRRTLLCVFLRGGADTLNMIVPYGDDRYYKVRPHIAIRPPLSGSKDSDRALRLDDFYAFHPSMAPLHSVFKEGRMGIVQAVGSDNPTGSHFDAQDQMEHGESYGKTVGGGWLGRYLRHRPDCECGALTATAFGTTIPESLHGAPGVSALTSLDQLRLKSPSQNCKLLTTVLSRLYQGDTGMLAQPGTTTLSLLAKVDALRSSALITPGRAPYPATAYGQGMREIAGMVKADLGLEVACIDLGGWDTHFFQGAAEGMQADLIKEFATGLAAFDADLKEYRDKVTVIVMTEFGRRVYENGSTGTDHGRGFAFMATGEGINGGKVHGQWPGLEDDQYTFGPGGLQITCDYRNVLADILLDMNQGNVSNKHVIEQIFPGLKHVPTGITSRSSSDPQARPGRAAVPGSY